MGRLLVNGADGSVGRHLTEALATSGQRRRGGDIRQPVHERSPAHLMSHAAPGRISDGSLTAHVLGSKPRSARAESVTPASARIGRQAGAGACALARGAMKELVHQSVTAG
jgi:hypothetical protein